MNRSSARHDSDVTNPIIAFADVLLSLVLVLAFVTSAITLAGRVGWENVRYKESQQLVRDAVARALDLDVRPREEVGRNDPPGVQRWVYETSQIFRADSMELSAQGIEVLARFATVLCENPYWRRIRIEGHTQPPLDWLDNDWELSATRPGRIARVFTELGAIYPWWLGIGGRAGQNPIFEDRLDPRNERVEILLEYNEGPLSNQLGSLEDRCRRRL